MMAMMMIAARPVTVLDVSIGVERIYRGVSVIIIIGAYPILGPSPHAVMVVRASPPSVPRRVISPAPEISPRGIIRITSPPPSSSSSTSSSSHSGILAPVAILPRRRRRGIELQSHPPGDGVVRVTVRGGVDGHPPRDVERCQLAGVGVLSPRLFSFLGGGRGASCRRRFERMMR